MRQCGSGCAGGLRSGFSSAACGGPRSPAFADVDNQSEQWEEQMDRTGTSTSTCEQRATLSQSEVWALKIVCTESLFPSRSLPVRPPLTCLLGPQVTEKWVPCHGAGHRGLGTRPVTPSCNKPRSGRWVCNNASWVHHHGWVRLCMVNHCEPCAGLKRQSGFVTFAGRYAEWLILTKYGCPVFLL